MGCKKVLGWALIIGSVSVVACALKNSNCMSSIKRKGKKITKKMSLIKGTFLYNIFDFNRFILL